MARSTAWLERRKQRGQGYDPRVRVLTASARRLNLKDAQQARAMRAFRQGWQSQAWDYRDAIGELRYAINFLANCAARMRLFPAVLPLTGETDEPVPIDQVEDVPSEVVDLCYQAIRDLGHGKIALKGLLKSHSSNWSVAGECFLLGMQDAETGEETWTIRSVDEIVIREGKYQLREIPSDPQGAVPWIDLDPDTTVLTRMWAPHSRFRLLADSPMRAMLDDCESLMILRRMIRATGRSRLAGRGILKVPDGLSIKVPNDDNDDPLADPFMGALAEAMMTPIEDEGSSSAVVPIVVRGTAEALDKLQHLELASQFDKEAKETRAELIGIIATSFDLPKEVVEGIVDLNHWSAWQVDDNTFRHHVEPHVIELCDSQSAAFLRPYLEEFGAPPEWVKRCVLWYDPTELVTHPDQTKDAMDLHDRLVISDAALLKTAGFSEGDRPTKAEIQVRLLEKMRTWPANAVMAFMHQWDPAFEAPPIDAPGTVPGVGPAGLITATPEEAPPGRPELPAGGQNGQGGGSAPPAAEQSPTPAPEREMPHPPAITAAGPRPRAAKTESHRLSRRLMLIDRELRARLQVACNQAMLQQLERAGERVRSRTAKDEAMRQKLAGQARWQLAAVAGREPLEAMGLTASDLLGSEWQGLRGKFYDWTGAAQKQALEMALRLAELDSESDAAVAAELAMEEGRDAAWALLAESMTHLAHSLLYEPGEEGAALADINPDTIVPTGIVRAALGVAGGVPAEDLAKDPGEIRDVRLGTPVGQVGTGATVEALIEGAGGEREGYEWVHGPALKPFEPHEALDGVQFESFDDEQLANNQDWPANAYFMPGDHQGCTCDFMPVYLSPSEASAELPSESEEPEE
jgi:hypothetical protein